MKRLFVTCLLLNVLLPAGLAGQKKPVQPGAEDRCPVCGMFTAEFSDFLAEILFKDGSYVTFDGPKDMFKYYFNLGKYEKAKKLSDIESVYVTEYYGLELMDAYGAYFVAGSDVRGPMGNELVAFSTLEDAKEFAQDHKGREILEFKNVNEEAIARLDQPQ